MKENTSNKKNDGNEESIRNVMSDAAKGVVTDTVKKNPKLAIIIPAIIVGVLLLAGAVLFIGFKLNWGKRIDNNIAKTANVVSEVSKIRELTTACFYEEMAIREVRYDTIKALKGNNESTKEETSKIRQFFRDAKDRITGTAAKVTRSSNEIVLIGKGKVRAGFDLSNITTDDVSVHGDTIDVTLPPVKIFDLVMNPSDFTTEYEQGKWSHELLRPIKEQAKEKLERDAIESGLLDNAKESGIAKLVEMFKAFGFSIVNITVDGQEEIIEEKMLNNKERPL